jgi:hypothetical protein
MCHRGRNGHHRLRPLLAGSARGSLSLLRVAARGGSPLPPARVRVRDREPLRGRRSCGRQPAGLLLGQRHRTRGGGRYAKHDRARPSRPRDCVASCRRPSPPVPSRSGKTASATSATNSLTSSCGVRPTVTLAAVAIALSTSRGATPPRSRARAGCSLSAHRPNCHGGPHFDFSVPTEVPLGARPPGDFIC